MIDNKKSLLVIRDVISREIYQLENKIMESRIAKIKYKYLEDRKSILIEYLEVLDEELLSTSSNINYEENNQFDLNIPMI